jgi:CBS-domain-containing membrane protein
MAAADVGRVPIVRRTDGKLVGIVARKDLLQARARMLAQEQQRERGQPSAPREQARIAG